MSRTFFAKLLTAVSVTGAIVVALSAPVSAQDAREGSGSGSSQTPAEPTHECSNNFLGLPNWYKYLEVEQTEGGRCEVVGPLEEGSSTELDWSKAAGYVGLAILEILVRLAAVVSLGFVIVGGFRYITSQGEPESAKSARQTIINSVVGLVIALLATGIVAFVANAITS